MYRFVHHFLLIPFFNDVVKNLSLLVLLPVLELDTFAFIINQTASLTPAETMNSVKLF